MDPNPPGFSVRLLLWIYSALNYSWEQNVRGTLGQVRTHQQVKTVFPSTPASVRPAARLFCCSYVSVCLWPFVFHADWKPSSVNRRSSIILKCLPPFPLKFTSHFLCKLCVSHVELDVCEQTTELMHFSFFTSQAFFFAAQLASGLAYTRYFLVFHTTSTN